MTAVFLGFNYRLYSASWAEISGLGLNDIVGDHFCLSLRSSSLGTNEVFNPVNQWQLSLLHLQFNVKRRAW